MLSKQLAKREKNGNLRKLSQVKDLQDFASNDYLGLSQSHTLQEETLKEWTSLKRLGSTGSRLLTGNSAYAEKLEEEIAHFHGYEAGTLFNCGYMANLGLISTIANEKDLILYDCLVHASLREGIRASQAQAFPVRHNDLQHLEQRLQKVKEDQNCFLCIESIYSTNGSIAPLEEIYKISKSYNVQLIVDESHATGVIGAQGKGLVFELGLAGKVFAQMVTFGKALGVFGAIVLGNLDLKRALINFAKSYIYTTALPYFCLAAIRSSYHAFPTLEKERKHLGELIQIANYSQTPIQPILIKDNRKARELAQITTQNGFDTRALLSPTVRRGQEIIRLTLHSFNSKDDLIKLLHIVRNYG